METQPVAAILDQALPDAQIVRDVVQLLTGEAQGTSVQIELDERRVSVPLDAPIDIVVNGYHKHYFDFPTIDDAPCAPRRRRLPAEPVWHLHEAGYCFATLDTPAAEPW